MKAPIIMISNRFVRKVTSVAAIGRNLKHQAAGPHRIASRVSRLRRCKLCHHNGRGRPAAANIGAAAGARQRDRLQARAPRRANTR